jgi:hypothetical protein
VKEAILIQEINKKKSKQTPGTPKQKNRNLDNKNSYKHHESYPMVWESDYLLPYKCHLPSF